MSLRSLPPWWGYVICGCTLAASFGSPTWASDPDALPQPVVSAVEQADGSVRSGDMVFETWDDYFASDHFRDIGARCGTPFQEEVLELDGNPSDCLYGSTNPLPSYDPVLTYYIPVVVHVLLNSAGTQGQVSDALIASQITVLNEDFQAIVGTPGEPGSDVKFEFYLATEDPDGNPTTGITRSYNDTWYNDGGAYYSTLAWDPNRYMNFYTNQCGGNLGYVPFLPQAGSVGSAADRLVIYWKAFGRPSPFPPYHLGRTATHEAGHFFGLHHTFSGGCSASTPPGCYTGGDRICDTNPEVSATFGCPVSRTTCALPAPYHNYMDYSDDVCMWEFTVEQTRRIRCTIENYRPLLYTTVATDVAGGEVVAREPSIRITEIAPNPFSGQTTVRFALPREGEVRLLVFDAKGRRVQQVAGGVRGAGEHVSVWNGRDAEGRPVAPGIYYARLEAGGETVSRTLVLQP